MRWRTCSAWLVVVPPSADPDSDAPLRYLAHPVGHSSKLGDTLVLTRPTTAVVANIHSRHMTDISSLPSRPYLVVACWMSGLVYLALCPRLHYGWGSIVRSCSHSWKVLSPVPSKVVKGLPEWEQG